MVYVIDEKVNPGTAVRALLYTDDTDPIWKAIRTAQDSE